MKSLLVFLSFFIYTFSYTQTTIFSDSVEFYFLKYLNEHRKTLYGDSVVDLTINKNASLACEHHNNYLFDMVWINLSNKKSILLVTGNHKKVPLVMDQLLNTGVRHN